MFQIDREYYDATCFQSIVANRFHTLKYLEIYVDGHETFPFTLIHFNSLSPYQPSFVLHTPNPNILQQMVFLFLYAFCQLFFLASNSYCTSWFSN